VTELPIDELATRLETDSMRAAAGVHAVVNTRMAEGIRLVSVRRGVDPRRFALLAFGGAAGLHATDVARQLDIGRVVVPRVAAGLSAWGLLGTPLPPQGGRGPPAAGRGLPRRRPHRAGGGHALRRAGLRGDGAARRRGPGG